QDADQKNQIDFRNFGPLTISGISTFEVDGVLTLNPNNILTVTASSPLALGALTNLNGGVINAAGGIALRPGQTIRGSGAINGAVAADVGSLLEATGRLPSGHSA